MVDRATYEDKEAIMIKYVKGCQTVIMPESLGRSKYYIKPEVDEIIQMAFTSGEAQRDHPSSNNMQIIANAM